jgi:SAM-dependent methyltransferase
VRLRRRREGVEPLALHDESVPLPPGAEEELRPDHPELLELRAAYAALDLPATRASRWSAERVDRFLDLRWFRGETLITWHYREDPRVTELKYLAWLTDVRAQDERGLLATLGEDGAHGCWTYEFDGSGRVSRDLLESIAELSFLERELGLSGWNGVRVLDVGAGYGRLGHRMAQAYPNLADYACVDAVPESTFVCARYLRFREVVPPARVVRLDRIDAELRPGAFDLAVNVHSFSEMPHAAVAWWLAHLARLEVPRLFLVPNEPDALLSLEADGSRRDCAELLAAAGYELVAQAPLVADPDVRRLARLDDRLHLYER